MFFIREKIKLKKANLQKNFENQIIIMLFRNALAIFSFICWNTVLKNHNLKRAFLTVREIKTSLFFFNVQGFK